MTRLRLVVGAHSGEQWQYTRVVVLVHVHNKNFRYPLSTVLERAVGVLSSKIQLTKNYSVALTYSTKILWPRTDGAKYSLIPANRTIMLPLQGILTIRHNSKENTHNLLVLDVDLLSELKSSLQLKGIKEKLLQKQGPTASSNQHCILP
jgi:hypothetical protein